MPPLRSSLGTAASPLCPSYLPLSVDRYLHFIYAQSVLRVSPPVNVSCCIWMVNARLDFGLKCYFRHWSAGGSHPVMASPVGLPLPVFPHYVAQNQLLTLHLPPSSGGREELRSRPSPSLIGARDGER